MFMKLRTSNILIKFLGVGFIILGLIRLTPFYNLESNTLLAFSLTAFFLLLSDLTQFISENHDNLKEEKSKKDKIIFFIISSIHALLVALSAISLVVVPYLPLSNLLGTSELMSINDMLTLSGLGVAISLIGLKSERIQQKEIKELADTLIEKHINKIDMKKEIEDALDKKDMKKEIEDVLDRIDMKKELENALDKIDIEREVKEVLTDMNL